MPRPATDRVTRGLRWVGTGLLVAGALVVVAGIALTRSIDALMAAAAIAAFALGLPGAAAFTLALWLENLADRLESPPDVPPEEIAAARGPNPFREPLRRYAIAAAAVLVAWGVRAALDGYIPNQVPFITFYLAVAVAAWAGGFGPAAFATLLCLVISGYYYVVPDLRPDAAAVPRLMVLGLFVLVCLGIAAIMATLREALARTRQLVDELHRRGAGGDNPLRTLAQAAPAPLFMTDRMLACTYCNKAWLALRGRSLTQELGHGWSDGVHPEDLVRVREARNAALSAGQPATIEYRLRLANGEFAPVRETVDVHRGARGEIAGLVGAVSSEGPSRATDLPPGGQSAERAWGDVSS